jgi:hypothetical protein
MSRWSKERQSRLKLVVESMPKSDHPRIGPFYQAIYQELPDALTELEKLQFTQLAYEDALRLEGEKAERLQEKIERCKAQLRGALTVSDKREGTAVADCISFKRDVQAILEELEDE